MEILLHRVVVSVMAAFLIAICLSLSAYGQSKQNSNSSSVGQTERANSSGSSSNDPQPPETQMAKTAENMKWFFTALVYPALVGAIFLLLIVSIVYIISKGSGFGYVRRITGALLPLLMLTFMLLVTDKGDDPIKSFFLRIPPFLYLLLGTVIGIVLIEFGRRLMNTDDDRWGSVYNIFLSLMVVFILYSIMTGFLDSLFYFMFAMIMAGGLDIVFRGQSEDRRGIVYSRAPIEGYEKDKKEAGFSNKSGVGRARSEAMPQSQSYSYSEREPDIGMQKGRRPSKPVAADSQVKRSGEPHSESE